MKLNVNTFSLTSKPIDKENPVNEIWIARENTGESKLRKLANKKDIRKWIYCGKNYLKLIECEKKLGTLERIPISQIINQTAWKIRNEYINWIGEMGREYGDSLRWWTSDLAEKNTMVSDLFQNICYLIGVEDIIQNQSDPLLIITEDWAFGLTLYDNLKRNGVQSIVVGSTMKWNAYGWAREILYFFGRSIKGIFTLFSQYLAANRTRHLQKPIAFDPGCPRTLIHTCVDDNCLGNDGTFKDRYFTKLPAWIKSQGYDVVTVIWPYNFYRPIKEVFAFFRNQKDRFIIPEDYFRPLDYPKAFLTILSQITVGSKIRHFSGRCIHVLLKRERIKQASSLNVARFLLYEKMVKRLKEKDFKINMFVDMFEDMKVEKPVTKALHYYYPHVKNVGVQHVPFDPFLLSYGISDGQISYAGNMFPDVIACCGNSFLKILSENGFPRSKLQVGPALRYIHLELERCLELEEDGKNEVILAVLPLEVDAATEIILKIKEAFKDSGYKIAIKAHPMMNKSKLLAALEINELPQYLYWADGDMKIWLSEAVCVIGTATAAIFEAVLSNVPVVIIGRDAGLERNPLAWWQDDERMFLPHYDVVHISKAVLEKINLSQKERYDQMKIAREIVSDCFNGWNEECLHKIFYIDQIQN